MIDRRMLVEFDPDHFAKAAEANSPQDPLAAFRYAHRNNLWKGSETSAGPGSGLDQTRVIAAALPRLCRQYGIKSLLDVPCGSFHWMAQIDLAGIRYTGGDLVPEVVSAASRKYGTPGRQFLVLDLVNSPLPAADLLFCRDCLVHLSFRDIARAIHNIRQSDITYFLTTTFSAEAKFQDIVTGDWRPINLVEPPFSFPPPIELLVEQCTEQGGAFQDKALALWRVSHLPDLSGPGS